MTEPAKTRYMWSTPAGQGDGVPQAHTEFRNLRGETDSHRLYVIVQRIVLPAAGESQGGDYLTIGVARSGSQGLTAQDRAAAIWAAVHAGFIPDGLTWEQVAEERVPTPEGGVASTVLAACVPAGPAVN